MYLRLIFFGMKKRTCSESSPVFCAQKAFSKKNSLTAFRENLAIPPFAEEPFYPPSNVTAPLEFDEASWEDLSKERLRLIDCWDSVCWRGWESNFFSIDCSLYMQCCFFWEDSWKKNLFLGTKWFRNVMTSESNMKRSVNRQQMHVYFFSIPSDLSPKRLARRQKVSWRGSYTRVSRCGVKDWVEVAGFRDSNHPDGFQKRVNPNLLFVMKVHVQLKFS